MAGKQLFSKGAKRRTGEPSEKVALFPRGHSEDKTKKCCVKCRQTVRRHIFLILIFLAMAAGIGLGTGLRHVEPHLTSRQISYLRFPGDLLLQMLEMLLIPLIVSSLITATTSLTPNSSCRMGVVSLVYYISTTALAATTGLLLVLTIRPGETGGGESGSDQASFTVTPSNHTAGSEVKTIDTILDLVRNLFPNNIIEATFRRVTTKEVPRIINVTRHPNGTQEQEVVHDPVPVKQEGTNVLGIITFSLALGIVISKLGNEGRPLAAFFEALNLAVMKLITLVIWYAPLGVMSLIAAKIVEVDDPLTALHQLSWFVLTVLLGLGIHGIIVLPLVFAVVARRNPLTYLLNMLEALITAFSTSSSAATLPVTMRCLVDNNRIDTRVVHFVTPVGTTVNMDGSAMYQAIAAIFLAQYSGMHLTVGQIVTVGITSIAASVGAAAVPSGSLVVIVMVLTSVGIPNDITLIAAIDWLLDRFRAAINVEGDAFAAGVVARLSAHTLQKERVIVEHSRFGHKETSLNLTKDDYYELP